MVGVDGVDGEGALGGGVVVIEGVGALGLSELIVHVVQHVEAVHVVELWRVLLIKQLLLICIKVLPIVYNDLSIRSADQPLVVGL